MTEKQARKKVIAIATKAKKSKGDVFSPQVLFNKYLSKGKFDEALDILDWNQVRQSFKLGLSSRKIRKK